MKSSCVSHPANNPALKIYDWQLKATGENHCAVAMLSLFESIINNDNGMIDYLKNFEGPHNKNHSSIRDVGIPLKLSVLREALFGLWAERKISEALELLRELGFISIERNPNDPRDRTQFIRFYPEICNEWIRQSYSVEGKFIGTSIDKSHENAKTQFADDEKAVCITPKSILQNAKMHFAKCQKAESCDEDHIEPQNISQVVDLRDNAKMHFANGENVVCRMPKGVTYINNKKSIQSIQSININQVENENLNKSQSLQNGQLAERSKPNDIETIIEALINQGLPAEKFNYPDALPAIAKLAEQGATVEHFTKAYAISSQATAGKGFGVNYLVRVVETVLAKSQQSERKTSMTYESINKHIKTKPVSERVYKNDFRNAMSWAADIIGDLNE